MSSFTALDNLAHGGQQIPAINHTPITPVVPLAPGGPSPEVGTGIPGHLLD